MLLQAGEIVLTIVFILITTVVLWLMLWLATRLIVSKDFASRKKLLLLLTALIMVVIVPIVSGFIMRVVELPGELMVLIRSLLGGGGQNYMGRLGPIIVFLIFIVVLKFIVGLEWNNTTWIALIGIFFLYLFYSLLPEMDFIGTGI